MSWRYNITKGKNEKVKSEGGFATEDEAQLAAREYLRTTASLDDPENSVYTVTTRRDYIKTDDASH